MVESEPAGGAHGRSLCSGTGAWPPAAPSVLEGVPFRPDATPSGWDGDGGGVSDLQDTDDGPEGQPNPAHLRLWDPTREQTQVTSELGWFDLLVVSLRTYCEKPCVFPQRAGDGAAGCSVCTCRTGGLAGLRCHHGFQPLAPPPPQQSGHTPLRGDGGGWVFGSVTQLNIKSSRQTVKHVYSIILDKNKLDQIPSQTF